MLDFNSIDSLKAEGFAGFASVAELWQDHSRIPREVGVYLVLNPNPGAGFMAPGVGGFFKGKDPNVPVEELKKRLVQNSLVVYIGKAGSTGGKATLYSRLIQYLKFGQGRNIGHWGGRHIWQLDNHRDLVFCWKPTPEEEPRNVERRLIEFYKTQFGRLPFANLSS